MKLTIEEWLNENNLLEYMIDSVITTSIIKKPMIDMSLAEIIFLRSVCKKQDIFLLKIFNIIKQI